MIAAFEVPRNSIQTAAENPTLSKATSTSTNLKPRKEGTGHAIYAVDF